MSTENNSTPNFSFEDLKNHIQNSVTKKSSRNQKHEELLEEMLEQFEVVDFASMAKVDDKSKLRIEHYYVIVINEIIRISIKKNWGLCRNHSFIYIYNGKYWKQIDPDVFKTFLGKAAKKMGVDEFKSQYFLWCDALYRQFIHAAHLPKPQRKDDIVLVNFKNGTFEISPDGQKLREHRRDDFILYELPFEYDKDAKAPKFQEYLNKVQPDISNQDILAEYLGYLFISSTILKLEKALLLYGGGANGKSVFFDIIYALLGGENNVSNYSLQSLTNENGYYRAMLTNKLVNYASEINGKLEASFFKLLVSGEPIEARLPHGKPMIITDYAKLIFNTNELPKDVEQTHAFFRRFLIVPFNVTIPESEQDKNLAQKIIREELPGVFIWVMKGLDRLLKNREFTQSESVTQQLEEFKKNSDSVRLFIEDANYKPSLTEYKRLIELYREYKSFCSDNGLRPCSNKTFSDRLKSIHFDFERKNAGQVVYLTQENIF